MSLVLSAFLICVSCDSDCRAQQYMVGKETHLVFQREIQRELKLTKKQVKELVDARVQGSDFELAMLNEPIEEGLPEEEREQVRRELVASVYDFYRKAYSDVLTQSQLNRLRGLALQKRQRNALLFPFYRKELGMSDEQYAQFQAVSRKDSREFREFQLEMSRELAKAGFGRGSGVTTLMEIIDNPRKLDHMIDHMTVEQEQNLDVVREQKSKLDEFKRRKFEEHLKSVDPAIFRRWKEITGEPFAFGRG